MSTSLFAKAATKSAFKKSSVSDDAISFIEDEKQIHAQGTYYSCVPSGGSSGQILAWKDDGEAQWVDQEENWYGVEWLWASYNSLTRIGNTYYHKTLPIQSKFRGCITQGKEIQYYLDPDDWRFKSGDRKYFQPTNGLYSSSNGYRIMFNVSDLEIDTDNGDSFNRFVGTYLRAYDDDSNEYMLKITKGSQSSSNGLFYVDVVSGFSDDTDANIDLMLSLTWEVGSCRNGFDGTVAVETPKFYIKGYNDSDHEYGKVMVSLDYIDDTWTELPALLIDAYRATKLLEVPDDWGYLSTLEEGAAISVFNQEDFCIGGGTGSDLSYDETYSNVTLLGKPRTNWGGISQMRTAAGLVSKRVMSYEEYKNIFYWLYVIEYANRDVQDTVNTSIVNSLGYHTGGLGDGVTTLSATDFQGLTNYNPVCYNGGLDDLGNNTGFETRAFARVITDSSGTSNYVANFTVPRWHGFDNIFGDIYTCIDGIQNQNGTIYIVTDPDKYSQTNYSDYYDRKYTVETSDELKLIYYQQMGDKADIVPYELMTPGAINIATRDYGEFQNGNFSVYVGGKADSGIGAGLGFFFSGDIVSGYNNYVGFRCVINKE